MEATLRRLGEVEIIPSPGESKFVHPQTVMYHLDGAGIFSHLLLGGKLYHRSIAACCCNFKLAHQAA
jgi:hypothetical protein